MKYVFKFLIFGFYLSSCVSANPVLPITDFKSSLIYYYDRKEKGNLQVYSFDGKQEINLVNDNNFDYWWIKVSPDRSKFLCYRSPKGAGFNSFTTSDLMIFNIDGSNGKVIIPKGGHGWQLQAHAKWSPDGTKILGSAKAKDPEGGDDVYRGRLVVFNSDGSNPIIISKFKHDATDPSWSPDGRNIVYVGPSDLKDPINPEKAEIFQATLNSKTMHMENIVRLTHDNMYCYDPSWSPDGQWIAYSKGKFLNLYLAINHDLYKCRPDGSEDVLVLHDGKVNGVPTWSPDGTRLFFHVLGLFNPPPYSLYSCSANGGDKKVVLSTNGILRSTPSAISK